MSYLFVCSFFNYNFISSCNRCIDLIFSLLHSYEWKFITVSLILLPLTRKAYMFFWNLILYPIILRIFCTSLYFILPVESCWDIVFTDIFLLSYLILSTISSNVILLSLSNLIISCSIFIIFVIYKCYYLTYNMI